MTSIDETAIIWVGKHRQADIRPSGYRGGHRRHSGRRKSFLTVSLGTLLAAAFTVACAGAATPDPNEPTSAPNPISTPAAKPVGVGAGTYKVGADIKAGTYTTTVPGDPDDILNSCYWARLKNFDNALSSIIANDNLAGGAKGRVVVKKTDAGVEFKGECRWVRAAK